MKNIFILIVFFNSLLYSQSKQITDSIVYYNSLSNYNIKVNNYRNVLFYTQKAINYAEAKKNIEAQAFNTFKLGKIYFDLKKTNDAIETLSESVLLFKKTKINTTYAQAYYYLSMAYIVNENFNSADICIDKALSISNSLNTEDVYDQLNLQKGIIYKLTGNNESALAIFNTIIAKPDSPLLLNSKAEALYQIGVIEEKKNRNNLALNYFNKALELNAKGTNLEQKSNILLALGFVHEKMLDKSNAYSYLKQHLNLKERLTILNNEKLGIDDYENFKETQRLKKITVLNKQNEEKKKSEKFSKLINILAISLISILSLLSLSLYKNNIIRNKSNLLLKEKNQELLIAKEKAEKATQARSDFLSTVSHELRTPLNAINGITHLLLEENPRKSQIKYLSSLQFSGNYLSTFINDILEINKIDSNKTELEKISFNLKQLLKDIKNSLKEIAIQNNNSFKLNIDSDIPDYLIGDPTRLSQILMNLINNALKFTKNGSVFIVAKQTSLENNISKISFEIIDTGIGIKEDKLKTVFESFSQGSVEINRKYGGTGLGLTIVESLVKLLGGQIELKSEFGKGSTFSFELEFKVNEKQLPAEIKKLNYDDSIFANKNFLIVEDNSINQMITKKMLENKGIQCEVIDNGEDAIEIVRNNKFDMVLMDVHLPGMNGTEATKAIREFDPTTPIIAITAISLNENREMLLSFGMNDVITKPFAPEDFYATIAKNI
ncbi:response regulator [Flavobacterium sp. K5-23]|uniref:tetratricopeptide repeat-containing hybrid sensor histidine kinase/response regulator n=1 Tax=Flavobacterium sp. K5-23 TaxID=2746225 RepID=UPI00200C2E02|nr:response regulator [Flavobacterium sp. K5-23]UQD56228.1 response regulator [Flavobacterium sp. K5-23]